MPHHRTDLVVVLHVQPAMQKREHQSSAISTGCYLAQMVHVIDYPVTGVATVSSSYDEPGWGMDAVVVLQSCTDSQLSSS